MNVAVHAFFAALIAISAGCNHSEFELAPVRGVVKIDGQPLTTGTVMFSPRSQGENMSAGQPAFGTVAPDGNFELTTFKSGDGAVVGDHWIIINNKQKEPSTKPPTLRFKRLAVPKPVTIVAGQENFVPIELTSADVAKFGS